MNRLPKNFELSFFERWDNFELSYREEMLEIYIDPIKKNLLISTYYKWAPILAKTIEFLVENQSTEFGDSDSYYEIKKITLVSLLPIDNITINGDLSSEDLSDLLFINKNFHNYVDIYIEFNSVDFFFLTV